jgi:hypothetical protein
MIITVTESIVGRLRNSPRHRGILPITITDLSALQSMPLNLCKRYALLDTILA